MGLGTPNHEQVALSLIAVFYSPSICTFHNQVIHRKRE